MLSKSPCDLVVYDRYIGRKSNEVDKRLLKIRLPNYIARQPRSISQHKFWKGIVQISDWQLYEYMHSYILASEWKNFLFFYIPAVLPGILPDKYLAHVFLLIKSLRMMLSNEVSEENLNLCNTLVEKFCILFEDYYGA